MHPFLSQTVMYVYDFTARRLGLSSGMIAADTFDSIHDAHR